MVTAAAGLLLPSLAIALVLRRRCLPTGVPGFVPQALGLGIGLSSVVWWALLLLPLDSRRALIIVDGSIWIVAVAVLLWLRPRGGRSAAFRWTVSRTTWMLVAVFVPILALACVSFVAACVAQPHGEWDAWAIWNLRARFLYRGYPSLWREILAPSLAWSHPDYPLLLPISIARFWSYAGRETIVVPMAVAAFFAAGAASLGGLSVARARSVSYGLIAAAAMLAVPTFVKYAPSQCADMPVAFYMLSTIVWTAVAMESPSSRGAWVLAGASAGLAAWTKNEGLLFLVAFVGVLGIRVIWLQRALGIRTIGLVLVGAAPMLAALAVLKWLTPMNDLVAAQSLQSALAALSDGDRVASVASAIGRELWFGGARWVGALPILVAFTLLVGLRKPLSPATVVGLATVTTVIVGYGIAYVVTPHDLAWHMRTSLDRVILQTVPTLVWCGMMAART